MQHTNANPSANPAAAPRKPGVLLVDDAAAVRSVLGDFLFREGFFVWVAADGEKAVDLFRRHGGDIDLVVLDQVLPQQDGLHTLDQLRTLNPQVQCRFLTGAADPDTEEELRRRGIDCVLHKPIGPEEITAVLHHMISQATGLDAHHRPDGGRALPPVNS